MLHFFFFFFCLISLLSSHELPPSIPLNIPMRDGKELAADLYLPSPEAKNLPCLLIRSPAGRKTPYALFYLPLLKEGYALVIQETRSSADLEGKTIPYLSDGWGALQDGYDTVAFLEKSPYTNGKIGTLGPSALGITQLMMAPTNPPGLQAQYILFATSDLFNHGLYQGGELYKHQVEGWLGLHAKHPSVYHLVRSQPIYNEFWKQFNMLPHAPTCCTPALHVGGWYDSFLKGTLEAYVELQNKGGKGAKNQQKLVIGPWIHLWPLVTTFGEFSYPESTFQPPYDFSPEKWFGYYLKKETNGIEKLPNVLYYVMGPFDGSPSSGNKWKTAQSWPIPHDVKTYYLNHDQTLTTHPSQEKRLSYLYNPENPIPTLGGRNLFLTAGPVDQSPIENRSDLIAFTSAPLEDDLEITGDVKAYLYVSTNQEDSAFSIRLTDVYPDGKSILIADGITRLSHAKKDSSEPPYEVEIDLWPTSIVFAKGHRLRLVVSSSNYPRFEKHLNTLNRIHENSTQKVAENSIYMGPRYHSRLLLPVIN